jgi:hypothetical protein
MIINNFHIKGVVALPNEADAPLLVDPDAVLPLPVVMQSFKMVGGRDTQGFKDAGGMKHLQLDCRRALDSLGQLGGKSPIEEPFGLLALEGLDHDSMIIL